MRWEVGGARDGCSCSPFDVPREGFRLLEDTPSLSPTSQRTMPVVRPAVAVKIPARGANEQAFPRSRAIEVSLAFLLENGIRRDAI